MKKMILWMAAGSILFSCTSWAQNNSGLFCSLLSPSELNWKNLKTPGSVRILGDHATLRGESSLNPELELLKVPPRTLVKSADFDSQDGQNLQALVESIKLEISQTPTGAQMIRAIRMSSFGFPQLSFLYERTPGEIDFDGWTFEKKRTYLTIRSRYLPEFCSASTENDLIRVLSHEWSRFVDAKAELIPFQTLKTQLQPAGDPCQAYAAMAHPLIRLAAGTLRATQVENYIASELGFPDSNNSSTPKTCSEKLKNQLPVSAKYLNVLADEWGRLQLENLRVCRISYENLSITESLKILQTMRIKPPQQTEMSLCDFLISPSFTNPENVNTSRGPSPPRIGDGTGMVPRSDQIETNLKSLNTTTQWEAYKARMVRIDPSEPTSKPKVLLPPSDLPKNIEDFKNINGKTTRPFKDQ